MKERTNEVRWLHIVDLLTLIHGNDIITSPDFFLLTQRSAINVSLWYWSDARQSHSTVSQITESHSILFIWRDHRKQLIYIEMMMAEAGNQCDCSGLFMDIIEFIYWNCLRHIRTRQSILFYFINISNWTNDWLFFSSFFDFDNIHRKLLDDFSDVIIVENSPSLW